MQRIFGKTYSRHTSWLYLFLGGFLLGTFLMNLWRNSFLKELDLLSTASLSRMKYLEVDSAAFLSFVLKERLGMALLLCLFATTCIGTIILSFYIFGMGALTGMFLSIASIRYGLKGVMLVLAGAFPHYLLLVPACIMLLNWCYRICIRLYDPKRDLEYFGTAGQYRVQSALQLFIILLIVIIGCFLESYVNPILLSQFLKIFYY